MYVNISRSKLLINKSRYSKSQAKKVTSKSDNRCNHCGGLVRNNGELTACIMCSRVEGHSCSMCSHVKPSEIPASKKSSA